LEGGELRLEAGNGGVVHGGVGFCLLFEVGDFPLQGAHGGFVLAIVDVTHCRCQLGERNDVDVHAAVALNVGGAEVDQVLAPAADDAVGR
jgi:hypothetical protein